MRRFKFRPFKISVSKWRYNGVKLDSDVECPAILCASEEDEEWLLGLVANKVEEWKEQKIPKSSIIY